MAKHFSRPYPGGCGLAENYEKSSVLSDYIPSVNPLIMLMKIISSIFFYTKFLQYRFFYYVNTRLLGRPSVY